MSRYLGDFFNEPYVETDQESIVRQDFILLKGSVNILLTCAGNIPYIEECIIFGS